MSAWTFKQTLNEFDNKSVASDGVSIWFVQHDVTDVFYQVMLYNPIADTLTAISNTLSWGVTAVIAGVGTGQSGGALVYFAGNLYVAVYASGDGNPFRVYKYSGAGTAWTNVLAATEDAGPILFATTTAIIAIKAPITGETFTYSQYSTNGTAWSSGGGGGASPYTNGKTLTVYTWGQSQNIVIVDYSQNTPSSPTAFTYRLFTWSGTSFGVSYTYTEGGGSSFILNLQLADLAFWTNSNPGIAPSQYTLSLGSSFNTPGSEAGQTPTPTIGFLDSIGYAGFVFYLLSSGNWTLGEAIPGAGINGTIRRAVLLASGKAYVLTSSSLQQAIFSRDDIFPPPGTSCKFYSGVNSLTFRSNLSISGVNPGALAISDAGLAVVGNRVSGNTMVQMASGPYTSFSNITGAIPTGSAVTSIKFV